MYHDKCPVCSRPALPGSAFRDLFPSGTHLQSIGPRQATNINHLRQALSSSDPAVLRDTLIGVLFEYGIVSDRNRYISDTIQSNLDYIAELHNHIEVLKDQVEILTARVEVA